MCLCQDIQHLYLSGGKKDITCRFWKRKYDKYSEQFLISHHLYLLFLPLLESRHLIASISSPIPSTCLQKCVRCNSFLPFSLPIGRILGTFQFPAALCILRCLPCAAWYMCTKLNVKSSYEHIEQWMKWWDERKQQLLQRRSIMRWEGVVKYVPLV